MSSINRNNSEQSFGEGMRECSDLADIVKNLVVPGSFIKYARAAAYQEPEKKPEIYMRAVIGEAVKTLVYAATIASAAYYITH